MSISPDPSRRRRDALYYPFHLCHERTLQRLLAAYDTVHFRDFMALRLTPLSGITAYTDRMGDGREELVHSGRLVQGHKVSGPVEGALEAGVDADLADLEWRALFHDGLREDRRFQRGLFDLTHAVIIGGHSMPGPAALLRLLEPRRRADAWTVARLRALTGATDVESGLDYEYGLALVKTSAALRHTIRLATEHALHPVTDSAVHYALFEHMRRRDALTVDHQCLPREGY